MRIANLSSYKAKVKVHQANNVELVHSGPDFFDRLENIINNAKHEIHYQTYSFQNDETGNRIAEALLSAAKRGVTVYMVLDAYGSKDFGKEFKKKIRHAGIQLRFFGQLGKRGNFAWGRRLHHKIVVVDRYTSLVGGINTSNRFSEHGIKWSWFDYALLIKGDACVAIAKVCRKVYAPWFRSHKKNYPNIENLETGNNSKKLDIQLLQNDWLRGNNHIAQAYSSTIKAAKSDIIIANSYFMPGKYFRGLLKDASERGVKVKVLLPKVSDIPLAKDAMHYVYRYLRRNNIEIYEWQPSLLHSKIMCVDGKWCTVGSYNLNYLSAYASVEFNIGVLDNEFSASFEKHLNTLLNSDSVEEQDPDSRLTNKPLKLIRYWCAYRLLKLMEAILITFPGQNFFKKDMYS